MGEMTVASYREDEKVGERADIKYEKRESQVKRSRESSQRQGIYEFDDPLGNQLEVEVSREENGINFQGQSNRFLSLFRL